MKWKADYNNTYYCKNIEQISLDSKQRQSINLVHFLISLLQKI